MSFIDYISSKRDCLRHGDEVTHCHRPGYRNIRGIVRSNVAEAIKTLGAHINN